MIEGKILFDQIPIIKENKKTVWSPDLMQLWIDTKKIGEYTQEVTFDGVDCLSGVMNELLDVTLQNLHEESLLYFEIRNIPAKINLDFNILKMLARKMTNLRRLTIRELDGSSETTKEALR